MIKSAHFLDAQGNPAGGSTFGDGFAISWRNGPLREPDGTPHERNGAFVEDVLESVIDRIDFYERSRFACDENKRALLHLRSALNELHTRTARRLDQGTEGTHQGN